MFSSAYALHVKSTGPSNTSDVSHTDVKAIRDIVAIFLVLLIVDIAIMIFAIYATVKCSESKKWPTLVPILLILCMIALPGIGGLIAVGTIIYYFTAGCGAKQEPLRFQFF